MATKNNNIDGMDFEERSMEPAERIKALAAFANTIEVDFNVPIRR